MDRETSSQHAPPWTRVAILLTALVVAALLAKVLTGSFLPEKPPDAILFQNGLLLIVLGSALIEHKFTKPADSVLNALMGIVTLTTVYPLAPRVAWWSVFSYCGLVFGAGIICVMLSTGPQPLGLRATVTRATYGVATFFGRARVLYSVVFLFALFAFYTLQSPVTVVLVLFWGVFVAVWPLGVPGLLGRTFGRANLEPRPLGTAIRTDWPNVIHAEIHPSLDWSPERPKAYRQADGNTSLVLPLYSQPQGSTRIGTGLCVPWKDTVLNNAQPGYLYDIPPRDVPTGPSVNAAMGVPSDAVLVGFVVEDSVIQEIRFETWATDTVREGHLVWTQVGTDQVFYQVTNAANREDTLAANRHGYQVAFAAQVGTADRAHGFVKYTWVPPMNTPVFAVSPEYGADLFDSDETHFQYGQIPGTAIRIGGPFTEAVQHHTAILGVTGCGKTELALDLVRHAAEHDTKILCVDLTAKYISRLASLDPVNLSLSEDLHADLSDKIFAVETGKYGAGDEKKGLKELDARLRANVDQKLEAFLTDGGRPVGILALEEISNTKATLHVTALYLTSLLTYAKTHSDRCPQVLVVLEEAHTVIPEASTMGLGDYESRGLVGKIAQIALQGRKYRVGLLVIAQRTATVSKTVLTQCNTIVSFACIDDTSLGFLSNVVGRAHVGIIPNLPFLNAVVFGKGVKAQRPLVIAVPYDPRKEQADFVSPSGPVEVCAVVEEAE